MKKMIKLLIGGSPCTHWSIAQKNNRETEPEGLGWELFKNYLIAKEKFKPDFFLYENNKSAAQAIKDQISQELEVPLMYINSALVSAQNRQRFYAFNWIVDMPEDRGILLKDILESGIAIREKEYTIDANYFKTLGRNVGFESQGGRRKMVAEPINVTEDGKSQTLKAQYGKNSIANFCCYTSTYGATGVAEPVRLLSEKEIDYMFRKEGRTDYGYIQSTNRDKAQCITANLHKGVLYNCLFEEVDGTYSLVRDNGEKVTAYEVKDGFITIKDKRYPIKLADGFYILRKLTVTECCRLQTLPDDYCRAVSNTQAYKGLGNGWTAEVIIHILNGALKDVPRDEEIVVLSMYDGIGTGRYCLDKMGFTNVKYYAYEIDKFAKQVAMSNYPDIIQMGDAFDVREEDWELTEREDEDEGDADD